MNRGYPLGAAPSTTTPTGLCASRDAHNRKRRAVPYTPTHSLHAHPHPHLSFHSRRPGPAPRLLRRSAPPSWRWLRAALCYSSLAPMHLSLTSLWQRATCVARRRRWRRPQERSSRAFVWPLVVHGRVWRCFAALVVQGGSAARWGAARLRWQCRRSVRRRGVLATNARVHGRSSAHLCCRALHAHRLVLAVAGFVAAGAEECVDARAATVLGRPCLLYAVARLTLQTTRPAELRPVSDSDKDYERTCV